MSEINWNCHSDLQGVTEITVGQTIALVCEGPIASVKTESLEIKTKELNDEVAALSLLQVGDKSQNQIHLVVTSYRVGEHKSDEVVLWDGQNKIDLKGFEWTVKSILKKDDPSQQPQAFPAFPMVGLTYPIWFWILLGLILVGLIVGPVLQFQKIKKRRKQFEDLKNLDSAASPLDAFFKEMRKLEKFMESDGFNGQQFIDRLQKEFRVFLSRTFQLPIHLWGENQSLREIRRKFPKIYRDHHLELSKFFKETKNLKNDITKKDCTFLQREAQKIAESMQTSLEKYHKGKR